MTVHLRFQDTLPLRVPEWIWAGFTAAWGWNIMIHPSMFANNPRFFSGVAAIMPQGAWGSLAICTGLVGLIALGINGFWRATPFIRTLAAFGRAMLWLLFFFGLNASGNASTGPLLYLGLVVTEIWNIYRAMGDARTAVS